MSDEVRLTKRQTDNHRKSIQVSNLISLLQRNAEGTLKNPQGEIYELSPAKVKSIQVLLDRALPTLQAIDHTVKDERPQLSPAEVEEELAKLLRSMPRERVMRLLSGSPVLKTIDGEVIEW